MEEDVLSSLDVTFTPEELGTYKYAPKRDYTDEDRNITWSDYGRALLAGTTDIGAQVSADVQALTGSEGANEARQYFNELSDEQINKTSLAFQRASNSSFLPGEGEESVFDVGLGNAIKAKAARAAPSLVAALIPSGIALKVLRGAGLAVGAGAAAGIAKGTASALNAGDVANQIYNEVDKLSNEELMNNDIYAGYRSMGMSEKDARLKFMQDVQGYAPIAAAAITYATGGLEGQIGARLGGAGAKGLIKGALSGLGTEALQEGAESGSGAYLTQSQLEDQGFGQVDWENIIAQTIEGGVVGGVIGGAVGGVSNIGGKGESIKNVGRARAGIETVDVLGPSAEQQTALSSEVSLTGTSGVVTQPGNNSIYEAGDEAFHDDGSPVNDKPFWWEEVGPDVPVAPRGYMAMRNTDPLVAAADGEWRFVRRPEPSNGRTSNNQPADDVPFFDDEGTTPVIKVPEGIFPGDYKPEGPGTPPSTPPGGQPRRSRAGQALFDLGQKAQDTPVPESQKTIEAQRQQLVTGERPAVLYTPGTQTPGEISGMKRLNTKAGVIDYNPSILTPRNIMEAIGENRLNEVLELGPYNKEDAAQSAANGSEPVAVVARTGDGTESRAAASTRELAEATARQMGLKSNEATLNLEPPEKVIADRVKEVSKERGKGKKAKAKLAKPVTEAPVEAPAPQITEEDITEENAFGELVTRRVIKVDGRTAGEIKDGRRVMFNPEQLAAERRAEFEARAAEKAAARKNAKEDTAKTKRQARDAAKKETEDRKKIAKEQSATDKVLKKKGLSDKEIAGMSDELKQLIAEQDKEIALIPASADVEAGERMQNEASSGAVFSDKIGMRTGSTIEPTRSSEGRRVKVTAEEKSKAEAAREVATKRAEVQKEAEATAKIQAKGDKEEAKRVSKQERDANTLDREIKKIREFARENGMKMTDASVLRQAQANIKARQAKGGTEDAVKSDLLTEGTARRVAEQKARVGSTLDANVNTLEGNDEITLKGAELENAMAGKSAADVATLIAQRTNNPSYRVLARRIASRINELSRAGARFTFTIVQPGTSYKGHNIGQVLNALKVANGVAHYVPDGPFTGTHVYINGSAYEVNGNAGTDEEIVLHELLHAVTTQTYEIGRYVSNSSMRQSVEELHDVYNQVVRHFNQRATYFKNDLTDFEKRILKNGVNALANPKELITWSMTNQEMQDYLRTIPSKNGSNAFTDFVRSILKMLGLGEEHESALSDVIRITDKMLSIDPTEIRSGASTIAADFSINPTEGSTAAQLLGQVTDRVDLTNTNSMGRGLKRAFSTTSMIARSAEKFGSVFGELARRVSDLTQRMDRYSSTLLKREGGGMEIVREGSELARKYGQQFNDLTDIMFRASELNVNLAKKGEVADNRHLGEDAVKGWQGKAQQKALEEKFRAMPQELQDWALKTVKFGRDEHNARMFETIQTILRGAGIEDNDLAKRVFEGKMTDEDRERFKTEKIVAHLDAVADFKKLNGWYVPFRRTGDYVVTSEVPFKEPKGKNVTKIDNSTFIFVDPQGLGSESRARDAARNYVQDNETNVAGVDMIWVDKNDPTKEIPGEDNDAIRAARVRMQNKNVEFFEDEKAANDRAKELGEEGHGNVKVDLKRQNPNARWGGLMPSQYATVIRSLTQQDAFKNLPEDQQQLVIQAMKEANVRLLPGTRIQQTALQRRNVTGYSRDLINSMAAYSEESANYRARLKFQPAIDDALKEMNGQSEGSIEKREITRELENRVHMSDASDPTSPLATASRRLRQISMLDKLAGVSFHVINSMEPWTTSLPVIGGRHGFYDAMRTLKAAYNLIGARGGLVEGLKDTARAYKQNEGFTDYVEMFKREIMKDVGGERGTRLASVIQHLEELNLIGDEAGMEMSRLARPSGNLLARGLDRADLMARQVGQTIESINRAVTGLAAYDLEYKRTGDHQKSLQYAADVVDMAMGNYARSNASPIFNTPLGAAVLQFKKFAQKTYYLLGKTMGQAIQGDREAQKQFAALMFTHALVAGALGLPLEPIKFALLASNALGMTDFTYGDFEELVRATSANMFGATAGEALTRGMPRLIGIDVSSRMSLADLMTFSTPKGQKADDIKAWLFDALAGAPAGLIIQQIEGAQQLFSGNFAGAAEKMIPIKAARDINQAISRSISPQQSKFGQTTVSEYSPLEAGLRAIGFKSAREAEIQEMRRTVGGDTFDYTSKRAELVRNWVGANPKNRAKEMIAIEKFNRGLPKEAQISRADLLKAEKSKATENKKGMNEMGLRFTKRTQFLKDEIGVYNVR